MDQQQQEQDVHDDQQTAETTSTAAVTNESFFARLGKWFRRGTEDGELPLMRQTGEVIDPQQHQQQQIVTRSTFLRPWAKNEQRIERLQEGFTALTDLMRTIRDNLDDSNRRQEQLIQTLSRLPQTLEALPESNRVQSETLKAIHRTIEYQNLQQEKLTQILSHISETGGDQRKAIDSLRQQIDNINEYEQAISSNLSSIGVAMQGVSKNSQTSAEVLEQVRDTIRQRDTELERVLHKQGNRFTTLLAVAIFMSVVALAAVAVIGYLGYMALLRGQ